MAETDHPNGTCGVFCPYCVLGIPRDLEAVREYEFNQGMLELEELQTRQESRNG